MLAAIAIAVPGQPSARAWSDNPAVNTPVCAVVEDQLRNGMPVTIVNRPNTISDGAVGAIIAWHDRRAYAVSLWDLYAQKVEGDASLPVPPKVTGLDPVLGDQGQSITGENFTSASSASFGPEATVDGFSASSDTSILADITIDLAAAPGTRDIGVTTGEGVGTLPAGLTIYPALVADFYADRTEVAAGQEVHFTDLSSGGVGLLSYEWDFGDTGTSTDRNPTHACADPGSYTISLTVTDTATNSNS